jgi:peptide/nickel transport system permease protein
MEDKFQIVGIQNPNEDAPNQVDIGWLEGVRPNFLRVIPIRKPRRHRDKPILAIVLLLIIVTGCLACEMIMTKDPAYMDLKNYNLPPNGEFLFGTDSMGRDVFSMIWYGGRVSLFIGVLSTLASTAIAVVFGAASGIAPGWLDELLMRLTEILLSVPSLLLVVLIQAILGEANVFSISLVIGVTSWTSIAKVVRTEVRGLRESGYVIASKCMGGGFFHILWHHLAPNFVSSIMFMVVMNVRGAIVAESTLSFMGIGLPLHMISWGSMLSLSEKALLTNSWWMILIPGIFLVVTLLSITSLGNFLQKSINAKQSNL